MTLIRIRNSSAIGLCTTIISHAADAFPLFCCCDRGGQAGPALNSVRVRMTGMARLMGEARLPGIYRLRLMTRFAAIFGEQPKWRPDADIDCDYYDGAQMSAEVMQRLKEAGIPPQDSNLIKPTINAVLGLEARSRTDYKVTSDDESQAEIAEGLSAKNQRS